MRHVQITSGASRGHHVPWRRLVRRYAFPALTGVVAVAAGVLLGTMGT